MDPWQTYQSLKKITRIGQFICKILILAYWYFSMAPRIWNNNSDMNLLKSYKFLLFVAAIFVLICFGHGSGLAFLLSLNFPFTWDYNISTRDEIFHILHFFVNSVYRVEISTRDENLHKISPLGKGVRIVIPFRATWAIRKKVPSKDNTHFPYMKANKKQI